MGFSDLSMLIFVSERSLRKAGIIHFRQKESDVTLFSLKPGGRSGSDSKSAEIKITR
jgi:hypothetical protein